MLHGRVRPFARTAGNPAALAAQAWQAAVIANSGTVSAGRLVIVNNFIAAEISAGTWALTDDYWPLWGENSQQALTSLKQRRLAAVVAAPTFTADRGYTFNGTTQYIQTGFIAATHTTTMTPSNMRAASYERLNIDSNTYALGANSGSNIIILTRPRLAAQCFANLDSAAITYTLAVADSRGYTAMSRSGAAAAGCFAYKNGVSQTQTAAGAFGTTSLPTHELYICAQNNVGAAVGFRAAQMSFVCVGAALTDTQELAQYTNVQAWATAIGAQV